MQPIDIFIDWENVGAIRDPGIELQHAETMIEGLKLGLSEHGYSVEKIVGFGSMNYGRLRSGIRKTLRRTFVKHHGDFIWSDVIADRMMIKKIAEEVDYGVLSPTVALVTCDGHFAKTALWLKDQGYRVIVIGFEVSKKLTKVADEVFNVREIMYGLSHEEYQKGIHDPPLENLLQIPPNLVSI